MRKNWKNNIIWICLLLLPFAFIACNEDHGAAEEGAEAAHNLEYTCPMHPQIIRGLPGSCPICGMDLVAKQTASPPGPAITADLNYLLQPANQTVVSNIKTTQPVKQEVENSITMNGVITYDTRRQYIIPARFGGRIEKLYVQFNYQPIRKGQKLYDIYSPELVTAQKELLYLLQNDKNNAELIKGAKQKLSLLGATDAQINQIIKSGKETYTFTVYSPYSGYVLDPAVTAAPATVPPAATPVTGDGMGGMGVSNPQASGIGAGSNPAATPQKNGFAIREGMYVTTGQALLKVIDASGVWAQFNLASSQAMQLKEGTPLTINFNQLPSDSIRSKISLVEPVYESGGNFARVRASLPAQNNQQLIGQLITGEVSYSSGSALWVPEAAVIDLGASSVAFRQINGVFKPVKVNAGKRTNGQVEVLAGLNAQDVIAANAQFLVDSESFIRVDD